MLACCVAGCGRVGFGEVDPGTPSCTGLEDLHDEDGDGVRDDCDVCPSVADPAQMDTDGDGVGDSCDREPGAPRQRLKEFMPMNEVPDDLTFSPDQWVLAGDTLTALPRAEDVGAVLELMSSGADDQVFAVGAITRVPAGTIRQIIVHFMTGLVGYTYCEIYDSGIAELALTVFDGLTYTRVMDADYPAALTETPFVFTAWLDVDRGSAGCTATLGGVTQSVEGPVPYFGDMVTFDVHNVDVRVDSLTVIRTR